MTFPKNTSRLLFVAGLLAAASLGMFWPPGAPRALRIQAAETQDAPATAPTEPSDPKSLRIIAANVRIADPTDGVNVWANRRAFLVATVLGQHPDIVGCQEVTPAQAAYLIRELKGYGFLPNPQNNHDGGLAPLTGLIGAMNTLFYRADRFDLLASADGPLRPDAPQPQATENAYYTLAVLADRRHVFPDLIVIDTHLRHGEANATICAQNIRTLIAEQHKARPAAQAVVLGDMNHARGTAPYDALASAKDDATPLLVDTFDYAKKLPTERWGTYHNFTGRPAWDLPSDLIFVTPGLAFTPAAILRDHTPEGHYPTDHFLILTTLTAK